MADTAVTPHRFGLKHLAWRRLAAPAILLALGVFGPLPATAGSSGNPTLFAIGFA